VRVLELAGTETSTWHCQPGQLMVYWFRVNRCPAVPSSLSTGQPTGIGKERCPGAGDEVLLVSQPYHPVQVPRTPLGKKGCWLWNVTWCILHEGPQAEPPIQLVMGMMGREDDLTPGL
jgi:hypothetical protein